MKKLIALGAFVVLGLVVFIGWGTFRQATADMMESAFDDPDMGPTQSSLSKEEFKLRRAEELALMRGVEPDKPFDPQKRISAIKDMERMEEGRTMMPESAQKDALLAAWTEIGPNPIPNGQVVSGPQLPVSGRVISIAVHPTNPDLVYVGTAQGGLYRTTDGGTTWVPLMDNALSLAIGAIAIAPSQPETVYVGTGEHNFSADSYFGVGVYRIDNASTTATLTGPLNKDATNADIFTGRGISRIIVHPSDPATIFVSTTNGVGGLINSGLAAAPARGLYRTTNATSAAPVFQRITGLAGNLNVSVRDIAIDPANPNFMLAAVSTVATGVTNGIYVSNDALAASPSFTLRQEFTGTSTSDVTAEFAVNRSGQTLTLYAATGNLGGRVLRSTDNGVTWTQQIDNNFCTPQCFYNIAFAVDPVDANRLYLGGVGTQTTFTISTNGGSNFASSASGLHTDSHVIAPAPSLPSTVYFGSDGGIYKSTNSGAAWTSLNNSTFRATQFMGLAVHPTDPNFTIGGTQDNGTNFYNGTTWNRIVGGDGGYAIIDTNAVNTTATIMYHSFFWDAATQQIYRVATNGLTPTWTQRGCTSSGATVNGITCNGVIRFYAPLEQGPGTPNTIYFGSDRLYRSADTGLTHTVVSQNPIVAGVSISAIGISPQNDNVRVAGLSNGALWGTTTGSSTLVDLDPTNAVPTAAIARVVIDPQNSNTAYVTLSGFGVSSVWKTTNLSANPPTWTNASSGLPNVPANTLVVDPVTPSVVYVGTDIGVFVSTDSGATWNAFGTGLPRVAVFDMAKTAGGLIRIATHGRGMWQTPAFSPNAVPVTIGGRVTTPTGQGLRNAQVAITDPLGVRRVATTSSFGIYSFDNVTTGQNYIIGVASKRYRFTPQTMNITAALSNIDFVGLE
jgi:photosystem II stability/assembly factor-like uncharacterized protein